MPQGNQESPQESQKKPLIADNTANQGCGLDSLCIRLSKFFSWPTSMHRLAKNGDTAGIQSRIKSCNTVKEIRHLVNELDEINNPPLYYCVKLGHYEAAALLLKNGASATFATSNPNSIISVSLLHLAANLQSMDIAGLLLAYGASPTVKDDRRQTPFQGKPEKYREAEAFAQRLHTSLAMDIVLVQDNSHTDPKSTTLSPSA